MIPGIFETLGIYVIIGLLIVVVVDIGFFIGGYVIAIYDSKPLKDVLESSMRRRIKRSELL